MVKKNHTGNLLWKITSILIVVGLAVVICVCAVLFRYKSVVTNAVKIAEVYGDSSVLPDTEIAALINGDFSIYVVDKEKVTVVDEASPITGGSVKESSVETFRKYHNLSSPEQVFNTFGNMYFFNENNGHISFIFTKGKEIIFTYDERIIKIPNPNETTTITADYGDEYCIICAEDKVYSVNYDTMQYKVFERIDNFAKIENIKGILSFSTVVDEDTVIRTSFNNEQSSVTVTSYAEQIMNTLNVIGQVTSVTLNDDKRSMTILSTNADAEGVFSEISVYTADLYSDKVELNFKVTLPDNKKARHDRITKSIKNNNIIAITASGAEREKNIVYTICVDTANSKIACMQTTEISTENATRFNNVLKYN